MSKFVVINSGSASQVYPIDTPQQIVLARLALADAGHEVAPIYFGKPSERESATLVNGHFLFSLEK